MLDNFKLDFISILIFLGLVQGLFLSILFILKKGVFNRLLGILIALMALMLLDFYMAYSLISLHFPHFIDISVPFGLLAGPVVYFIIYYLLHRKLPKYKLVHTIPFFVYFINQSFYYAQSANFKYNSFVRSRELDFPQLKEYLYFPSDPMGIRYEAGVFVTISLGFYVIALASKLKSFYKRNRLDFLKARDSMSIWIKKLAFVFIGVVFYVGVSEVFIPSDPNLEYVMALILTAIIYLISIEAVLYSTLFSNSDVLLKYQKSKLPDGLRTRIHRQLQVHMDRDKPYLRNDFSLKIMAENVDTHPNYISQILNGDFGQSYHEYVTFYRIEAAKEYLKSPHLLNTNIEQISEMVGYNSKTAFNRAFKSLTGTTPLRFRKNNQ